MIAKEEQIKEDILKKLALINFNSVLSIEIHVDKGWVVLEGSVKDQSERDLVETVASKVVGVQIVTNKIAVVPTKARADRDIASEVVKAIDNNHEVNIEHVLVEVNNGIVSLNGRVPSWNSKDRASEAAASIRSAHRIQTIENHLRVSGF